MVRVSSHPDGIMTRILAALLASALVASPLVAAAQTPPGREASAPVIAPHAMVSAANPLAANAGLKVLREGGSAIDAAVAVQAVLGLVEPQASGIGGGALMVTYQSAGQKITAYDGRETAPAAAGPDLFLNTDGTAKNFYQAAMGGRSVGVPG